MIVFYNKQTGTIVGTIYGRIHTNHENVFIGDPKENDKLIIEWTKDDVGTYKPDHIQHSLFSQLEKEPIKIHEYRVVNGLLVKIEVDNEQKNVI